MVTAVVKTHRHLLLPTLGVLLLCMGCGDNGVDVVPRLAPDDLCRDHPDRATATFADASVEGAVRAALSVSAEADLTCGLLAQLQELKAVDAGIRSLLGIQNLTGLTGLNLDINNDYQGDITPLRELTGLTYLGLGFNALTDIDALGYLTSVTLLNLGFNDITDVTPLRNLVQLAYLQLNGNANLVDIGPLLDNAGLGPDDLVDLRYTTVSCPDVDLLRAKGVTVLSVTDEGGCAP